MQRFRPDKEALERLTQIEKTAGMTACVPEDMPEEVRPVFEALTDWTLTPEHVAAALGISSRTLSKLRIPHARFGITVRYHPEQVRRYIVNSLNGGADTRAVNGAEHVAA
jgi:polyisoprenoid-binding protein YceI